MLADIAQKMQHVITAGPIQVIHYNGRIGTTIKIQKLTDLTLDTLHPLFDKLRWIQLPFGSLETWVTDHAGSSTHQGNGCMAGLLKTLQHQQGHQMANV